MLLITLCFCVCVFVTIAWVFADWLCCLPVIDYIWCILLCLMLIDVVGCDGSLVCLFFVCFSD